MKKVLGERGFGAYSNDSLSAASSISENAVLLKGLPSNIEAEKFVLGSILLSDQVYPQVAGALEADDFTLEKHRRIFARMAELNEVVTRQQDQIDRLNTEYQRLLILLESPADGAVEEDDEPPPHY